MEKLKVFHVITKLELGGAQGNTLHTVEHLDGGRFEAELVCGRGGMLDRKAAKLGKPVHFLDSLIRPVDPASDTAALIKLRRLFLDYRPHIVHTHSSKAGVLGRIAAQLAEVPVIIHSFHGFGFNDQQNIATRGIFEAAEKFCAGFTDSLIFVSKANIETARRLRIGDEAKYRLIRSGIDLSRYPCPAPDNDAKRRELGLPPDGPVVVSVGNLKPQKNPLDFVEAARLVIKEFPNASFLYIGDGELREQVEHAALRYGIKDNCFFPGWRSDTPEILALASVFVLTSLWEGLPRSLVEALKSGVAPVVYDADGVRDIVRDGVNGFVIERKQPARSAEKIAALLGNERMRSAMSASAAGTDLSEFDINAMVRAQEKLYLELAAKAGIGVPA